MQVSRKPIRWPFVVVLVALLAFCLAVPRCWRSDDGQAGPSSQSVSAPRTRAPSDARQVIARGPQPGKTGATDDDRLAGKIAAVPAEMTSDNDVSLCAELPTGIVALPPPPGFPTVDWPTPEDVFRVNSAIALDSARTVRLAPLAATDLPPPVSDALQRLGRGLVVYSPPAAASEWILKSMASLGGWPADWSIAAETRVTPIESTPTEPTPATVGPAVPSAEAASPVATPSATTLRIMDPGGRLAIAPPRADAPPRDPIPIPTPTRQPPRESKALATSGPWSPPEVLFDQLARLAQHPESADWAVDTLAQLRTLFEGDGDRGRADALLAGLSRSAAEAVELAGATRENALRVELLRARWALERRLDCWTAMRDIRLAAVSEPRIASRGSLRPLFRNWSQDAAQGRRLESLSADLESYERSRDPQPARRVAVAQREFRSSGSDLDRALADAVEEHYRNANFRIALTADMINRFVSEERVERRAVWDRIAGTPVRGRSETVSRSQVALQPALGRWQMELQTDGVVESNTRSVGRARVYTRGETYFSARTPIVVDPGGAWTQSTAVTASNCSRLVGVSTGIDWIPLIGAYARNRAIEQYLAKRSRAKAEVEHKVTTQTMARLDDRTSEWVGQWQRDLENRLTDPLAKYGIEATPLELTTSDQRVVARLRIAGAEQLASHTPRPQALSDSVASVQIHESALTNAAVALELNGERLTAAELQTRLREKIPRLALEQPPEAPEDTVFQFAAQDAVRFHINGGRLELTLAVAEFYQPGQRIRSFIVHAYYSPIVRGVTAELVRDGSLGIEGAIGGADRARLHNVFGAVLSEERRLPIFRPDDPADPRLAGLMITQLVLEDGWLGMAIGPQSGGRVAERQRSLR